VPGLLRSPVTAVTAGALCIASSAIVMQLAGSSAVAAALFRCLFALPVLGVLAWREQRRGATAMAVRARWTARGAGVLLAVDLVVWSHSIAAVGAGLATVLGNLQVVILAGLAWILLGERPRRSLVLALPLLLGGVVLVAGLVGHRSIGHSPLAGVAYGAAASFLYSGYILVLRQAMPPGRGPEAGPPEDDPGPTACEPGRRARAAVAQPLYQATLGATATSAVLALALPGFRIGPLWPALGWLALLALTSQVLGWMLISASLPRLPAGLLGALLLVQPVGAVALGAAVLGQYPSLTQLGGVLIVVAGVLVAIAGPRGVPRATVPHRPRRAVPVGIRSGEPLSALVD
jgi:drug/metabolite transporter (DMT)-like permease